MDDIEFLGWVPSSVIDAAKELLPFISTEKKVIIHRLITDERMKNVWGILKKKRRSIAFGQREETTGPQLRRNGPRQYEHSVAPNFPEAWEGIQQRNMRSLFIAAAAGLYYGQRPVITRRELVKLRQPYLDMAVSLELTKISLHNLGIGRQSEISAIERIIEECKLTSYNIGRGWIIIDRNVSDPHLRGYLQELVKTTKSLFGSPLLQTAATIASVVFDRKITRQMVREAAGL